MKVSKLLDELRDVTAQGARAYVEFRKCLWRQDALQDQLKRLAGDGSFSNGRFRSGWKNGKWQFNVPLSKLTEKKLLEIRNAALKTRNSVVEKAIAEQEKSLKALKKQLK